MTVEEACFDRTFYLKKGNEGNICLKKSHNYQIQRHMYIIAKNRLTVVWFREGNVFMQKNL